MAAPKLFISYSWSNDTHEQMVIKLATELRESGVDVILDKWELKEGHDTVKFMEKMVVDPNIKKVLIICDKTYAVKADERAGGVGTETQIISEKIYTNQVQEKFVAIVTEKDEKGVPYLPTYYQSRIYIDLSEPDKYGENFDKLLKWIFDKPLYVKPEIGKPPPFLDNKTNISLGTNISFKRAIEAIRNSKSYASGAIDEYLNNFVENLEKFRIVNPEGDFDDAVISSIEDFIPYRNELIQLFISINRFASTENNTHKIHKFFENLIPYLYKPKNVTSWSKRDSDNFRFIIHELFLYAMAIFIKFDNFNSGNYLLEQRYYFPYNEDYGRDVMIEFSIFRENLQSLDHRNKRLKLNRISIRGDLLEERCSGIGIAFRLLMQADFVIFLRGEIEAKNAFCIWNPETLPLLGHFQSAFEIFARASSKKYFDKVKVLLAIDKPSDLEKLLHSYKEHERKLPTWNFDSLKPEVLLGYEKLATRP